MFASSNLNGKIHHLPFIALATVSLSAGIWYIISPAGPKQHHKKQGASAYIYAKGTQLHKRMFKRAHALLNRPWGYSNKHFASILAQLRPSPLRWCSTQFTRRFKSVPTPGGGHVDLDFLDPLDYDEESTPIVILLHGINGHSGEAYLEQAVQHILERNWRVVIFNYSKLRLVQSSCDNNNDISGNNHVNVHLLGGNNFMDCGDLNFIVSYLRTTTHTNYIFAVGFSLGGAKLVNYLGRTREFSNIDGACCVSSPLDCTLENEVLYRPNMEHQIYHFIIASHLKLWVIKHFQYLTKHPKLSRAKPFRRSISGVLWWLFQSNKVTDIDAEITCHLRGYNNIYEYYDDATGIERLKNDVCIPFLCLAADNDPLIPRQLLPSHDVAMANENVFIVNVKGLGGHIGFWQPFKGCWATRTFLSFFECVREQSIDDAQNINNNLSCDDAVTSNSISNGIKSNNNAGKEYRRQSSLRASRILQETSRTGLFDYFKLLPQQEYKDFTEDAKKAERDKFEGEDVCYFHEEHDAALHF